MDWSLYLEQQQLYALKYNNERHFQIRQFFWPKLFSS